MQIVRKAVNMYYTQNLPQNPEGDDPLTLITMQGELLAAGCSVEHNKMQDMDILVFSGSVLGTGYITIDPANRNYHCDITSVNSLFAIGEEVQIVKGNFTDMLQSDTTAAELAAVEHFNQYVTVVSTSDEGILVALPSGVLVTLESHKLF